MDIISVKNITKKFKNPSGTTLDVLKDISFNKCTCSAFITSGYIDLITLDPFRSKTIEI